MSNDVDCKIIEVECAYGWIVFWVHFASGQCDYMSNFYLRLSLHKSLILLENRSWESSRGSYTRSKLFTSLSLLDPSGKHSQHDGTWWIILVNQPTCPVVFSWTFRLPRSGVFLGARKMWRERVRKVERVPRRRSDWGPPRLWELLDKFWAFKHEFFHCNMDTFGTFIKAIIR